jgi:hypothetical protein
MPIQSVVYIYDGVNAEIGVRFNGAGENGFFEVLYADIPGGSWNPQRLAKFTQIAQEDYIDIRIPLDDPSLVDDPNGPNGVDPARPDFFWDTDPPNNDLVARPIIILNVSFDPDVLPDGHLNFTLTRAR